MDDKKPCINCSILFLPNQNKHSHYCLECIQYNKFIKSIKKQKQKEIENKKITCCHGIETKYNCNECIIFKKTNTAWSCYHNIKECNDCKCLRELNFEKQQQKQLTRMWDYELMAIVSI